MSDLSFLQQKEGAKQEEDRLGGGGVLDSGADVFKIDVAFLGKSQGGANSVTLHLTKNGYTLRETLWVTSGTAKGCKNYFIDREGNEVNLPGYDLLVSLCMLTLNKHPSQITTEEKVIKLYDYEAKKELPTTVDAFTELENLEIGVGLLKQIVDKTTKADNGEYVPTGETREINVIDKFFDAQTGQTVTEKAGNADANFIHQWKERNTGKVVDKSTKDASGAATGAPTPASGGGSTPSLFGK